MRILLSLAASLSVATTMAQAPTFNRFSLEAQFGLNNPIAPMASAYDSRTFGLLHTGLSGRFIVNDSFGNRLGTAFDRFEANSKSIPFTTDYLRVSGEGVINLANVLHFGEWTDRFGLLLHAGMGYSTMRSEDNKVQDVNWDQMLHAMIGLTPQVRLSNRMALSVDVSVLAHAYQSRTYDFSIRNEDPGIDGYLYNVSIGLQYSFGKQAVYADWVKKPDLSKTLEETRDRLSRLEEQLKDDDNDGVANYLDRESGTAEGAIVNTKGETQLREQAVTDTDGDGLTDEKDDCPTIKGKPSANGCPETGDASLGPLMGIRFETQEYVITQSAYTTLDYIADILRRNPDYKLEITGHTDNQGTVEDNQLLSEKRASAVRNYLLSKGVEESRLSSRGMGAGQPVASNETEAGRAGNRRVEFVVKF
jgi:OOP family OmpA-OmpF porin